LPFGGSLSALSADCGRENIVRTLTSVNVDTDETGLISITVKGTAFLKNMVRIIAGTLIDMGRGALPPDTIETVLCSGDRSKPGQTAPAKGLVLVKVYYPDGLIRCKKRNKRRQMKISNRGLSLAYDRLFHVSAGVFGDNF
jgi:tRNA pseudouridine38-40 synthase